MYKIWVNCIYVYQNRVSVIGFSGLLQYRFSVTFFPLLVADSVERCFMDSTGLRSKNL